MEKWNAFGSYFVGWATLLDKIGWFGAAIVVFDGLVLAGIVGGAHGMDNIECGMLNS